MKNWQDDFLECPPARVMILRAARLACPLCGAGHPFRRWLVFDERCDSCGFAIEREAGYFLGSIYFNYGITGLLTLAWVFVSMLVFDADMLVVVGVPIVFAIVFPLWFLRYCRAFWLVLDLTIDPPRVDEYPHRSD